ncbi:MAG: hypothetical protein CUN52_14780, partial [Phototrophicales bacterium]
LLLDGRGMTPDFDFEHLIKILGFIIQVLGLVIIPLGVGLFALLQAYNLFAWVWSALAVKSPQFQPLFVSDTSVPVVDMTAPQAEERGHSSDWKLTEIPVLLFISWWAVFNLLAYTLAGEKMPWLGTHMSVPMIFLAGWYFGRIIDRIDWGKFAQRTWLYLFILPLMVLALFRLIIPPLFGEQPFLGTDQIQLVYTYNWLGALVIFLGMGYFAFWLAQKSGWSAFRQMIAVVTFSILMVLTFRSAWIA